MSKFFRSRPGSNTSLPSPSRFLNRALFFAAALVCLWLALRLATPSDPAAQGTVVSDEAGTVFTRASRPSGPGTTGYLLVLVILAGGGAFALYLRRRSPRPEGAAAPLRTLHEHLLGPDRSLRLVACGDEVLLLGVTSGQITLLKTYPAGQFPASPVPEAVGAAPRPSFADVLGRLSGPYLNTRQAPSP